MKKEDSFWDNVEDFTEDIEDDVETFWQKFKKSGFKYLIGAMLVFIFMVSIVSYYIVPLDPYPKNIPLLSEVVPSDLTYERINASDYSDYIIVDAEIKGVADRIVTQSCDSSSKVCYSKALFYFVKDNFNYVSDPLAFEYVKTARESLVNGGGDCDDASVLLSTLLESIGIETRLVFVPGHVYVQAKIPEARGNYKEIGDWISLDATCEYCEFGEIALFSSGKEKSYSY